MSHADDTIFALASGQGRTAISVIRISGGRVRAILETVAGGLPSEPRRMMLRRLVEPSSGETLDRALVVWMPAPASFTGEDQAELHIHGGTAVRAAVLAALDSIQGCRLAEPGEFTRRAFLNGRMDLSAVEGVADLIDAETQAQRRQALRQLDGHLGQRVEGWRQRLIEIMAMLEAALDFSDEGDVPETLEGAVLAKIAALQAEIAACLDDDHRGERLRQGFVVVLAGPPNVGKSTLLNALARRDVAIVSPLPGTTRDAIEVRLELDGFPVTLIDTAGLRDTADPIEREGVARTLKRIEAADLILWLVSPGTSTRVDQDWAGSEMKAVRPLRVGTKSDLASAATDDVDLTVSALSGAGLSGLLDRIAVEAQGRMGGEPVLTRERHRRELERVDAGLGRAVQKLESDQIELAAEDVRLALRAMGAITGRVDLNEVLDHLFSTFCLGK